MPHAGVIPAITGPACWLMQARMRVQCEGLRQAKGEVRMTAGLSGGQEERRRWRPDDFAELKLSIHNVTVEFTGEILVINPSAS